MSRRISPVNNTRPSIVPSASWSTRCPCIGFFGDEHGTIESARAVVTEYVAEARYQDWLKAKRKKRTRAICIFGQRSPIGPETMRALARE
jgi:hypothetical protein